MKTFCYLTENRLFTVILTPGDGKYPTMLIRNPYVDALESLGEDEIVERYAYEHRGSLGQGIAVVVQHCRGRGKSGGDCIPYINEREDGLQLQAFVREQPFYNGTLLLSGGSYLTSVHYATAPFADDIKGANLAIQDCERYNISYRNGFFKTGLHGNWYVGMYKPKKIRNKHYTPASFLTLPLSRFSETVFGEPAPDLDETLKNPDPDAPFWQTHFGGSDARRALHDVGFPVLLETGFYDLYTGGIFDMWRDMTPEARSRCALVVSANDHGDSHAVNSMDFPDSRRAGHFPNYKADWFEYVLGRAEPPFALGKVTYYTLFENAWHTDDFTEGTNPLTLTFGKGVHGYTYNPFDPPSFRGGLSRGFGGAEYQDKPNSRHDIMSFFTAPITEDKIVRGRFKATIRVRTDCEDTCFFMRISIRKPDGDFPLRDEITNIIRQHPHYRPNEWCDLVMDFDDISMKLFAGDVLRVDIASADAAHYVRHTNRKGLFSEQTTALIAHNAIDLDASSVTFPVV